MKIDITPQGGPSKPSNPLQWLEERVDRLHALTDKYLDTDDDLPLAQHLLLLGIAAFFVVFIIWANFATLEEVTKGEGRIIPSSETQVIQSLEGGIVDEILVREGQRVKTGQILVKLRDIAASSDLGENQAKYFGLQATVARLQAEATGKSVPDFPADVMAKVPQSVQDEMNTFRANQSQIESQVSVFRSQLSQKEGEVREISSRITDLRRVIALSREKKAAIEPLVARGSAPKLEILDLESDIAQKETEINSLETSLPRARAAVGEINARIGDVTNRARADAQIKLSQIMIEVNALKQATGALQDRKTRAEVKSPVDGIVKDMKVTTVGGVVKPGDAFIDIVPVDDLLLVEARVRPADIAFLRPGQDATIKISAYDFSIYGGLKAKLVDISADTITNEKGESFYRVRLRTNQTSLRRKGEVLPIIPGMVATADILTGHKTVMEYLMKPFLKTVSESMRER